MLSQLIPDGAALIRSWVAFALLFGAISHSHPISTHRIAHAVRAPRTPSNPPGRPLGHTIAPMIAYSSTAPGAPVSGLAIFMNSIPNASPNHHTTNAHANETASAGLTVRRDRIPTPIATCTRPAMVLNSA